MRTYGEKDSFNVFAASRKILMDIASKPEEAVPGVPFCFGAVVLVLTIGIITCVIKRKMGGRSWSGDQRRHNSPRKPKASTVTRALYSPAQKAAARKEELLHQHHLQMLSVQRDFALGYPHSVCRPDLPECRSVDSRTCEVPKTYIRPPPNRIVCNTGKVCPGGGNSSSNSSVALGNLPQVHRLPSSSSSARTRSPANHGPSRSRGDLVNKHTSSSSATLLLPPSTPTTYCGGADECTVHGWQPPGNGRFSIDLFTDNKDEEKDGDHLPKYEEVVFQQQQQHYHNQQGAMSSLS